MGFEARPAAGTVEPGLLAGILEASTQHSLIAIDSEGLIVLWNAGAEHLYGYTADEIRGRPISVLHTAEDIDSGLPVTMLNVALRDGKWEGRIDRVRKDGSEFTARVVVTPRNVFGRPAGFLLISTDITDVVRVMRELQDARAFMTSLLDSAPDAMVIVDSDGAIQFTSVEAQRLFGYTREELLMSSLEALIPDRYRARHPEHRAGFFREPRVRPMGVGLELWGRRKDGTEFPVEISLSPMKTDRGLLATAAIRDVTESKRVERQLREANVQLEAANRAKDRFLASMSHELRTPLNAILGFTGTILMELPGPLNDEQTKQLQTVQTNGRHLLSLINDLLDLARIQSGKVELNIETVGCQDLLEELAVGLRPIATEKGIALEVLPSAADIEIRSDRRSLNQILINLTNNAIKFTDAGAVRLRMRRHDACGRRVIRFDVIDTGRGIRAEDQQRLFAAFEQIGASASSPYDGTGLGLYICQTIATLIGGSITFQSEYGRGSTFTLEVPE